MDYIKANKEAWEEAFDQRINNYGENDYLLLNEEELYFFQKEVRQELKKIDFKNKDVAQFCTNNGRELMSLVKYGAKSGTGFDIAENILNQARENAKKAGINNCEFVAGNILEMPKKYYDKFDFIFFTVGAITWFKDLKELFGIVSKCLKKDGIFMISDFHPVINMLAIPGEEGFDLNNLNKFTYSYFRKEPWIENNGIGYISGEYESKTFTSFSHTISDIINSLSYNGLKTFMFSEYDYDIGICEAYNNKGIPLSFLLMAQR